MTPVYGQNGRLVGYSPTNSAKELYIEEFEEILGERIHYIADTHTDDLCYISVEAFQRCVSATEEIIQRYRLPK